MRGMFRSAVLSLALSALGASALAQSFEDLQQGPMAPCLLDHFDPQRYQSELADLGWVPAPDEARGIVIEFLALGFLALTHPALPGRPDNVGARVERAQALWTQELSERTVLIQGDAALYLRGQVQPDGIRRIDCWLLTPDADFVNALIDRGLPADVPAEADIAIGLGPFAASDRSEATVIATRNPRPPGPVWGLATQLLIRPAGD